jgi:hypothetical protein
MDAPNEASIRVGRVFLAVLGRLVHDGLHSHASVTAEAASLEATLVPRSDPFRFARSLNPTAALRVDDDGTKGDR